MTQWLSVSEAARSAGVTADSIRRWCNAGLLEAVKTSGGHRRINADTLRDALQNGTKKVPVLSKQTAHLAEVFEIWQEQIESILPLDDHLYPPSEARQALAALVGRNAHGGLLHTVETLISELRELERLGDDRSPTPRSSFDVSRLASMRPSNTL